jgi:cytochrome oxidase Cu insertion factor (SCO1/SenC/PrrC family)
MDLDLQKLLDAVVDDESDVYDLSRKNEVVVALFEFQELDSAELLRCDDATCSWEFSDQLHDAEEIDVRIVDCKVDEERTGTSIDPEILLQVVENLGCFGFITGN